MRSHAFEGSAKFFSNLASNWQRIERLLTQLGVESMPLTVDKPHILSQRLAFYTQFHLYQRRRKSLNSHSSFDFFSGGEDATLVSSVENQEFL